MKIFNWNALSIDEKAVALKRPSLDQKDEIATTVQGIISDVRENGDKAVLSYTQKFDFAEAKSLKIDLLTAEQKSALDPKITNAIDFAYKNISQYHHQQGVKPFTVENMQGVTCKRMVVPYQSVGLYVPGGTAPLVSTTLMNAIPAMIAGSPNIVLSTPFSKEGVVNPYILYAAEKCGITNIYGAGGAQAIAAMAFGTETLKPADKIFGPGNAFVTEAKKQVSLLPNGAALDMPAGPSEVCVIADKTSDPEFVAADLLSQAEHDVMSQVCLIATNAEIVESVQQQVQTQLQNLSRKDIASQAIVNSIAVIVDSVDAAIAVSNQYAPEHLIISIDNAREYQGKVTNAGSIFLGLWTPESAGDYCSGTNHVLPTYGYARQYSGLSVESFQKTISVQEITKEGLTSMQEAITTLATIEGLDAHAKAVTIRMNK